MLVAEAPAAFSVATASDCLPWKSWRLASSHATEVAPAPVAEDGAGEGDSVGVAVGCEVGVGVAALEASAAGRPVAAFRSGGLPEVVVHGRTGIIVPKGDAAGLAVAVADVLDDPGVALRLGEGGRRHASRFSLAGHVDQLTNIYETMLDGDNRSKDGSAGAWRG